MDFLQLKGDDFCLRFSARGSNPKLDDWQLADIADQISIHTSQPFVIFHFLDSHWALSPFFSLLHPSSFKMPGQIYAKQNGAQLFLLLLVVTE